MKKLVVMGIVALLVLAGGAVAFAMQQTATAAEPVAAQVETPSRTVAEAVIVPVQRAALSSQAGGRVAELLVSEGQQVEAGQVILRLDSAREAAAVAQAEAALNRAKARLAELQAGPRAEEIAVAESVVETAKAQLARVQQGARSEDIAAGEAAVAAAEAALNRLLEGSTPGALAAARAEVENAKAAVAQAQAAYDRVAGNPDVAASPQALALQQATNVYNAAAARLADLERGSSKSDIAGARARLQQAQAQLAALKAAARPADVAVAQSEVQRAEKQLALAKAGSRSEAVAAAEADVAAAQASLDQARAVLALTEVRAPFAGAVAELNVRVGEQVAPGARAALLADLSSWQIETSDLTELHVAEVKPGDKVSITVDALRDVTLSGTVLRVGDVGESNKGDISYKVVIQPDATDARLKWNMTAAVTFETK